MPKILMINTLYYPYQKGGAEISVQNLAESFALNGKRIYLLTIGRENKVLRKNGVIIIQSKILNLYNPFLNSKKKNPLIKIVWHLVDSFNLLYYFKFKNIIKRINPYLVHTNNIQGFSSLIWQISTRLNISVIHTVRDYYLLCHRCFMFKDERVCQQLCGDCKVTFCVKKCFHSLPSKFIFISNSILNEHIKYLPLQYEKLSVIPNSLEVLIKNKKTSQKNRYLKIGYIGKVTVEKGIFYLLEELKEMSNDIDDFCLVIAGKASEDAIKQIDLYRRSFRIELLGHVKQEQFYNQIDLLVVPSLWNEPFGRVVVEGLSYNKKVLVSEMGGLSEFVDSSIVFGFKPEKSNLKNLITRLRVENLLYIEDDSAKKYLERFSNEVITNAYLAIFDEVSSNKFLKV